MDYLIAKASYLQILAGWLNLSSNKLRKSSVEDVESNTDSVIISKSLYHLSLTVINTGRLDLAACK